MLANWAREEADDAGDVTAEDGVQKAGKLERKKTGELGAWANHIGASGAARGMIVGCSDRRKQNGDGGNEPATICTSSIDTSSRTRECGIVSLPGPLYGQRFQLLPAVLATSWPTSLAYTSSRAALANAQRLQRSPAPTTPPTPG